MALTGEIPLYRHLAYRHLGKQVAFVPDRFIRGMAFDDTPLGCTADRDYAAVVSFDVIVYLK